MSHCHTVSVINLRNLRNCTSWRTLCTRDIAKYCAINRWDWTDSMKCAWSSSNYMEVVIIILETRLFVIKLVKYISPRIASNVESLVQNRKASLFFIVIPSTASFSAGSNDNLIFSHCSPLYDRFMALYSCNIMAKRVKDSLSKEVKIYLIVEIIFKNTAEFLPTFQQHRHLLQRHDFENH